MNRIDQGRSTAQYLEVTTYRGFTKAGVTESDFYYRRIFICSSRMRIADGVTPNAAGQGFLASPGRISNLGLSGQAKSGRYLRMLMARAPTITIVTREIVLSTIISILALPVSGRASVGLNAVAVA